MPSSKKLATFVSSIASFIYFCIIIFQVPLFRIPCRKGICTTPIEVTVSQLIDSEVCPLFIVKGVMYPGAFAKSIFNNKPIPSFDKLVNFYKLTKPPSTTDFQRLEVIAGSYMCVVGALLSLIKPGRMSIFGIMLILWGLLREYNRRKFSTNIIPNYSTMFIVSCCAFLSIRKDVRKIISVFKPSKHRWSKSKKL